MDIYLLDPRHRFGKGTDPWNIEVYKAASVARAASLVVGEVVLDRDVVIVGHHAT
jgi:hypothetical protein